MQANTGAIPSWSTATYPSTTTVNQVLYSATANVIGGSANFTFNGSLLNITGYVNITDQTNGYQIGGLKVLTNKGTNNIMVGVGAGILNSGNDSVFIGYNAGTANLGGSYNTFVGSQAGDSVTSGSYITAIGYQAGQAMTSNSNSTFLGYYAGYSTTGSDNTFIGYTAGQSHSSGQYNTGLGSYAGGGGVNSASNNTYLGYYAGNNNTGASSIFIGSNAGRYSTDNNVLYIDNQNRTNTAGDKSNALIYGIFAATPVNQQLTINGQLNATAGGATYAINATGNVLISGTLGAGAITGTSLNVGSGAITTTGTGTFGAGNLAIPSGVAGAIGNITSPSGAGSLFLTSDQTPPTAYIFNNAGGGYIQVLLASSTYGGYFQHTTSANSVYLADGTYAINATGNVLISGTLGAGAITGTIGRFTTGVYDNAATPLLSIDTGNRILYASNGSTSNLNWNTANTVQINGATDTSSALAVDSTNGSKTYAINTFGDNLFAVSTAGTAIQTTIDVAGNNARLSTLTDYINSVYAAGSFTDGTNKVSLGSGGYAINATGNVLISGTLGAGAITGTSITDSGLTITRIPYVSTGGLLADTSDLTLSATTLTLANRNLSITYTNPLYDTGQALGLTWTDAQDSVAFVFPESSPFKMDAYISGNENTNFSGKTSSAINAHIYDSSVVNHANAYHSSSGMNVYVIWSGTNTNNALLNIKGALFLAEGNLGTTGATNHIGIQAAANDTADENYGGLLSAGSATTNYGVYATASGGTTSWAGYFDSGNVYIKNKLGIGIAPTALLYIKAGTATAGTAPLKFTTGTSLTAAEAGAMEYTTDDLFFTIATGTARKRLLMADPVGGLTSTRVPYVTTNGRLTDVAGFTFNGTTLTAGGLTVNGNAQLGNATTNYHGINMAPVSNMMLSATWSSTATNYFISGTQNITGNSAGNRSTFGYDLVQNISGTDTSSFAANAIMGVNIDINDSSTLNSATLVRTATGVYADASFSGTNTNNIAYTQKGGYFLAGGDMGTNGATTHYGVQAITTGTADNNYGISASATGATNNYDLYLAGTYNIKSGSGTVGFGSDNLSTTGKITIAYSAAAPALTTNGDMSIAYVNPDNRIYFYSNGGQHYVTATAGFEVPNFETIDPISGDQMKVDDIVLGKLDSNVSDGALHGVWVKWDSVKKDLMDEVKQNITLEDLEKSTKFDAAKNTTFISWVKSAFESFGIIINDGIASIKEIVVDKITAKTIVIDNLEAKTLRVERIEMKDQITGEIYCTWIEDGDLKKAKGDCANISNTIEPSVSPEPTSSPNPEPTISPEPTASPEPSVSPDPLTSPAVELVVPENPEPVVLPVLQEPLAPSESSVPAVPSEPTSGAVSVSGSASAPSGGE